MTQTIPEGSEAFLEYLGGELGPCPQPHRVAFAAILAERCLASVGEHAGWEPGPARQIVEAIWDHACGRVLAADQLDRFEADLSQIWEMVDPDRLYSEDAYRAIRLLGLATRCCGARAGVPETVAVARESLHIAASSFLPEHHVADARLRQQWNREAVQAEASVQTKLVQRLRATPDVGRDTVAALRRDLDIPKVT